MTGSHPLAYTAPHAYHMLGCPKTSSRIDRHNHRTTVLHTSLCKTNIYTSNMVTGLFTSSASKKQIDLKLDSTHHSPTALALDTTISCLLLPTYLASTAVSAEAPLQARATHKITKHGGDCALLQRAFMPFVGDTLGGIGPPAFRWWLRDVFAAVALRARSDGEDPHAASFALEMLLANLLATLTRDNVNMIERLTIRDVV